MNARHTFIMLLKFVFLYSLFAAAANLEAENLLPDSSFENSKSGREFYPISGDYRSSASTNWKIDPENKYHGKQSLCIFGKKPFYFQILSEDSIKNVFSVYLKGTGGGQQVELGFELLSFNDDGGVTIEGKITKIVKLDNSWKRYFLSGEISSKKKRNWVKLHIFRLWIRPVSGGQFWADAAQFERGQLVPGKYIPDRTVDKLFHPVDSYKSNVKYRKILNSPSELKISKIAGKSGKIELTVVETEGKKWQTTPVWGGIPFPKGELFYKEKVALYDKDNRQVPVQTKILSRRHIDGSITSLLLDFQTRIKPHEKKKFFLVYGKGNKVAESKPAIITDNGDRFTVKTGTINVEINKNNFMLFNKISKRGKILNINKNNIGSYTVDHTGNVYSSSNKPPLSLKIEMNGPLHGIICAKGKHYSVSSGKSFLNYEIRIHAFAGKDYFLIQYTIENHQSDLNTGARQIFMRLPVYADNHSNTVKWAETGNAIKNLQLAPGQRLCFTQLHDYYGEGKYETIIDNYSKKQNKAEVLENVKLPGWFQAGKSSISIENFWQMNPKSVEVAGEYIAAYMWPEQYVRYLDLPSGISSTMNIYYRPVTDSPQTIPASIPSLLLQANPEWTANTGVFGYFLPVRKDTGKFEFYNRRVKGFFDGLAKCPGLKDITGMFDYGEIGNPIKWMNNETTVLRCLITQYLRTGDPKIFYRAQSLMRHLRDVDTCHWENLCLMHHPSAGIHTTYWFGGAHFWITGLIWSYWLTGDMRTYETAKGLGAMLVAWSGKVYVGRNRSRMLYHLAELYDLTHLKCFREAFERQYNHGKPTEITGKYNQDYYGGTGLSAIMRWYTSTGEMKYLSRLKKEWEDLYRQRANSTPGYRVEGDRGWCIFTALAEAARETKDKKFIEGFLERMIWFLVSTHGFGANAVRGAEFLDAAEKLGASLPAITPEYLAGIDILTGKTPKSKFILKVIKEKGSGAKIKIYRTRPYRIWRYPRRNNDIIKYCVNTPDGKSLAKGSLGGKAYLCREIDLPQAASGNYTIELESINNGQGAVSYSTPKILLNANEWFKFRRDRGTTAFVKFYFIAPLKRNHIILKYKYGVKKGRKTQKSSGVWLESTNGDLISSARWLNPLGTEWSRNGDEIGNSKQKVYKFNIPEQYRGKVLAITITFSKGVWRISGLDYPWLSASPEGFSSSKLNNNP